MAPRRKSATNTISGDALAAPAPRAHVASWRRFLAPYYVLNAVALLSYAVLRESFWNKRMEEREGFLNLPREQEIFLIAGGTFAVNYRKKATLDGVISLLFLYGKMAVLAATYYMDRTLFGWYFVCIAILFVVVGQPKYAGPSNIVVLNPASFERLVRRSSGDKAKKENESWLVYFHVDWSAHCVQHDPMIAELSLSYGSESLQFGKVDVNKHSDLAAEYNIAISSTSWQLPTMILFQNGEEVIRLPKFKDDGTVIKTILDKAGVAAVFHLEELKDGKKVSSFGPKTNDKAKKKKK
uniref:Thioredoxin domain-containing protein n=1 Tax=Globisporangium ultimum (strain ATCC 200006 / CBS 805.95 / DAOM BR144) TaxID=431595 RepID=K3WJG7_GLOUD